MYGRKSEEVRRLEKCKQGVYGGRGRTILFSNILTMKSVISPFILCTLTPVPISGHLKKTNFNRV